MCPCESPFLDKDLIALVEQFPGHSLPWLSQEAINQVKYLVSQGKLCVRYCGRSPHYYTLEQITTKQDPNEVPTFLPVLQSNGTLVVGVSGMDTKIHIFLDPTNNNIGVRVEDEWRWIVRGADLDEMQEKMEHQHDQLRQSAERIGELEFGCSAKQKRIEDLEVDTGALQDSILRMVSGGKQNRLQITETIDVLKFDLGMCKHTNKNMSQVLSQVSEVATQWKLARQNGTYTPPDSDYSAMDCVYQTIDDARCKGVFTREEGVSDV